MNPKIEDVVKMYMKVRLQKEEIERSVKEQVAVLNDQLTKLEAYLLSRMQQEGVTSYKTPYGTAFSTTNDYANVQDWDLVVEYVKQNDAYYLLDKRVNKRAVRSLIEEGNQPPPGVTYGTRLDVNVRKPTRQD